MIDSGVVKFNFEGQDCCVQGALMDSMVALVVVYY